MVDIEDLVETYRKKVAAAEETQKYRMETITPQVTEIFNKSFMEIFRDIAETVNEKVNTTVINFKSEGKNRFSIEGRFHRIVFQKGKIEIIDDMVSVNIIPLCVWKGVTKHLGPISFVKDLVTGMIKWDLPVSSVEEYTKNLLGKLAEDENLEM